MTATAGARRSRIGFSVFLRGLVVAGLVVDAVIHLQLASIYQLAAPGGIGQGNLFRIEAAVAILTALAIALRPRRLGYVIAIVVSGSALVAVLLYRYVDVPALGPIPSMYEPLWFTKKTVTAIAEAVALVAAVAGLATTWQSNTTRAPNHS